MNEPSPKSKDQDLISARYGSRATALVELGTGAWSWAYSFSFDGQDAGFRFGPYRHDFCKDKVMGERGSTELPIPKVTEIGPAPVGFFAISERRYGEFLDQLDEIGVKNALASLFLALDAMQEIDIADTSGFGHWDPDGTGQFNSWAQSLLDVAVEHPRNEGWRSVLDESPGGSEVFDLGYEKLKLLVAKLPYQRSIVHNDLLSRNVLVNDGKISAILDWGNSLYGDHLYDAALLLYWWSWFPKWSNIDIREELNNHWKRQRDLSQDLNSRLLTYQLHIGLEHIAYTAFERRPDDLARNKEQVKTLVKEIEQS